MVGMPYMRFFGDLEIEVTDLIAAAAFNMNWTADDGMLEMDDTEQMQHAVNRIVLEALSARGIDAGFRVRGVSFVPRPRQGNRYSALTFPEEPARQDDGTFPDDQSTA